MNIILTCTIVLPIIIIIYLILPSASSGEYFDNESSGKYKY